MRNLALFELKHVVVKEFLEELDIRNISEETTEEIRFSCAFPGHKGGDENPSAYMNRETTAWICHGCKRKGNAVTFLSDLHGLSYNASLRFIRERFGGGFQAPKDTLESEIYNFFMTQERPAVEPINYVLQDSTLSDFCLNPASYNYMQTRGFSQEILMQFQIGYDRISERVTIPIFDGVGRLVGFKGRSMDGETKPKYKVLGGSRYGFPRYHVGHIVFGLDKVGDGEGILVEGELNVLAMHQLNFVNTVALGGSTFTETHKRQLIDNFSKLTLFLDDDNAGSTGTATAIKSLQPYMRLEVVPEHDFDAADTLKRVAEGEWTIKQAQQTVLGLLSESSDTIELMIDELSSAN